MVYKLSFIIAKPRAVIQQQSDVRDDYRAAVPVDGMVKLPVDFLQAFGDSPPFPFGQSSMTTASGGIIVDMSFQRCVAKQVGMKNHTRIASRVAVEHGGYLEHFPRIDQPQGSLHPVFIRSANQCVKIARHTQVFAQLVAGQIGKPDQRVQRFLSHELIEQIYRNDTACIHLFPLLFD